MSDVVTTTLELVCIALLSLFLFAIYPPSALLPWAVAAGLMAYVRQPVRLPARRRR